MRSPTALLAVPLAVLLAGCPSEKKCPSGQTDCTGACIDLQTNPIACGACNHPCPAGSTCVGGQCQCPAGQVTCGTACVDLQADPLHCGSCDVACGLGTCTSGACVCDTTATKCTGAGVVCVDLTNDASNCGACRNACPLADEVCTGSTCACPAALPDACPSACVNLQTDPNNCMSCGNICRLTNDVCVSGVCQCPASLPDTCGNSCVDQQTDAKNCGPTCLPCAVGAACNLGQCLCPAGEVVCGTGSNAACTDRQTDPNNCGTCGSPCASGVACASGTCCSTSPSIVCGSPGQCCVGTGCCSTGGPCQTVHSNGLGQSYYDCLPLNQLTLTQAGLAADAWSPGVATISGSLLPACNSDAFCLCSQKGNDSAIWCAAGSILGRQGHVRVTTTGMTGCYAAICPTATDTGWN